MKNKIDIMLFLLVLSLLGALLMGVISLALFGFSF
jgi:hypothetical protein